jgi:hypothetical protein
MISESHRRFAAVLGRILAAQWSQNCGGASGRPESHRHSDSAVGSAEFPGEVDDPADSNWLERTSGAGMPDHVSNCEE